MRRSLIKNIKSMILNGNIDGKIILIGSTVSCGIKLFDNKGGGKMKKTAAIFTYILLLMSFSQVSMGWDGGKVLDENLEETGTNYISQSSPREKSWEALRILKHSNGDEVIDIFASSFLAPDNGKAEVKFTIDSNRSIKLDIYTWGGGIHNTARVYIDPDSSRYKKLISQMKSGNSMKIIVKNSENKINSFEIPLGGFTRAYNQLGISK